MIYCLSRRALVCPLQEPENPLLVYKNPQILLDPSAVKVL